MLVIYLLRTSPCVSSVLPSNAGCLWDNHSGGQPSGGGLHELAASSGNSPTIARWLVVSYTHLLTLTPIFNLKSKKTWGGYFLLPLPAVTNCFYFQKWSVLCCPDFPPAACHLTEHAASDKPERCFQPAKVLTFFRTAHVFARFFCAISACCGFSDSEVNQQTTQHDVEHGVRNGREHDLAVLTLHVARCRCNGYRLRRNHLSARGTRSVGSHQPVCL